MELQPCTRYFFSTKPLYEQIWRIVCLLLTVVLGVVLYIYWQPLRSPRLTYPFVSVAITNPFIYGMSRVITTLGSEGFFLTVLAMIYWSVNKWFAFWGLVVMPISILVTSEIPKDITRLPRPSVRGVAVPTYTFPSGHASGAVAVWGYAAVMLKRRWFWILAISMMLLVGLSRVILGYHFPGDVIGGFISGILFLALVFWLATGFISSSLPRVFPFWLSVLLLAVGPLALSFMPVRVAPGLLGYFSGAAVGYLLQARYLGFSVQGSLGQHLLRGLVGLSPLPLIIIGLAQVIPPGVPWLMFTQYALATFWITYLAPLLFIRWGWMAQVKRRLA